MGVTRATRSRTAQPGSTYDTRPCSDGCGDCGWRAGLCAVATAAARRSRPHQGHRRHVDDSAFELGTLGQGRSKGDDQPAHARAAEAGAGSGAEGLSVSLSHTYIEQREADATSPFGREMLPIGTGDFVSDRYSGLVPRLRPFAHGLAVSHVARRPDVQRLRAHRSDAAGCAKLAISNFKQGIVARGVLLDIARLKGVKYLDAARRSTSKISKPRRKRKTSRSAPATCC